MIKFIIILLIYIKMKRMLITGTNKGLGYQLVNLLLSRHPQTNIIATILEGDPKQLNKQWNQKYPKSSIQCIPLDISKQQSIFNFVSIIKKNNIKLNYLINNAGICGYKDKGEQLPPLQIAQKTFRTNTKGTITLTNALLESLTDDARIVNVTSQLGAIINHPQIGQKKLQNTQITLKDIEEHIQDYLKQCKKRKVQTWFISSYGTSKALLNAWSRFILQKQLKNNQKVVCMTPGKCSTSMGDQNAISTPVQGAQFLYKCIWNEAKQGVYYHMDKESDFNRC